MFFPCPYCQFLVNHHPQLRPLPHACPRCGRPLIEDGVSLVDLESSVPDAPDAEAAAAAPAAPAAPVERVGAADSSGAQGVPAASAVSVE